MKKIVPSIVLSFFSLPLAQLITYFLYSIAPRTFGIPLTNYSYVISLNFIALIIALAAISNGKSD